MPQELKSKIKQVSMDMWSPYRDSEDFRRIFEEKYDREKASKALEDWVIRVLEIKYS